jgi:surfeit locus 1 family protein
MALGTWQVQRRAWKLDLIERVEQRVHSAPVAVPEPGQWPQINAASHEYLPVKAQGRWLDKQRAGQGLDRGRRGLRLMTPLQLAMARRFWSTAASRLRSCAASGSSRLPKPAPSAETVTVIGLMRMSEPGGGFLRKNTRPTASGTRAMSPPLPRPRA